MYEPDVACQWNIKAPVGQRLNITFDSLNLAGNGNCDEDFLLINNNRYCNSVPTGGYVTTTENEAKIVFLSKPGISNKQGGFNISVAAVGMTTLKSILTYVVMCLVSSSPDTK